MMEKNGTHPQTSKVRYFAANRANFMHLSLSSRAVPGE